jgi:hypothetical protein
MSDVLTFKDITDPGLIRLGGTNRRPTKRG